MFVHMVVEILRVNNKIFVVVKSCHRTKSAIVCPNKSLKLKWVGITTINSPLSSPTVMS
ncbi:hypothetical protein D3C80_1845320 [compost metagenome]